MSNNEKQYYIYLRAIDKRIPVTKEEFTAYYKDIDVFRRKQQRHGFCVCTKSHHFYCDMNCIECRFAVSGNQISLEKLRTSSEGYEYSLGDLLEDTSSDTAESIIEQAETQSIIERLKDIMPLAIEIGKLRVEGKTDSEIADIIGMNRTTFRYKLEVLKKRLHEEFPDRAEFF